MTTKTTATAMWEDYISQTCLFLGKHVTKYSRLKNGATNVAVEKFQYKRLGIIAIWQRYK